MKEDAVGVYFHQIFENNVTNPTFDDHFIFDFALHAFLSPAIFPIDLQSQTKCSQYSFFCMIFNPQNFSVLGLSTTAF
jgi:hypothetical protein